MNVSNSYRGEEAMLQLLEELQTETEQKDLQIRKLTESNQQLSGLVEKLNDELNQENPKALRRSLHDLEQKWKEENRLKETALRNTDHLQGKLSHAENVAANLKKELSVVKKKERLWYRLCAVAGFYGFLVTIFTALEKEVFLSDVKGAILWLWEMIVSLCQFSYQSGMSLAESAGGRIQQPLVSDVVYVIVLGVITIVPLLLLLLLLFFIGKWIVTKYRKYCGDWMSVMVTLVSLAIEVFCGEWVRKILPVNLVIILLGAQMIYLCIRWYVAECREYRGY